MQGCGARSGSYSDQSLSLTSIELMYGFRSHIRVHAMPGGAESPDEVPGAGTACLLASVSAGLAWIELITGATMAYNAASAE